MRFVMRGIKFAMVTDETWHSTYFINGTQVPSGEFVACVYDGLISMLNTFEISSIKGNSQTWKSPRGRYFSFRKTKESIVFLRISEHPNSIDNNFVDMKTFIKEVEHDMYD